MPENAITEKTAEKAGDAKPLEDQQFVTRHSVTIGGERIDYTAKAGRMVLHDGEEQATPKVALFYTAYLRDGVESRRDRPLVFLWNGGPGSSAIWLHMFSLGPRRVVFEGDPLFDTSRWELRENEHSLLDVADLVFVDPPSTGFSRVAPGEDVEQFHGVEADAAVVGDFVVEFVNRERRGDSPIVLLGESYGTLRTPAVTDYLQGLPGFYVDGVVLVSSLMDVAGASFGVGTALGAIGMLPSYAATALYHGVVAGDLEPLIAEAEDFAVNDYSVALLKGSRLTDSEQDRIAKRMAELTGLSPDLVRGSNLRVTLWRYVKALLRDRRRTVGRLDTRWTGIDSDIVGEAFENDPSMTMIWGPATRAFNRYVREDLGFEADPGLAYRMMIPFPKWKPRETEQNGIWSPQLETATQLRTSMNRAPHLKVLLQSGYYDLGTPYFPAEMTFDHLYLEPERARNVTMKRYESGHMIYLHEPSLARMKADLVVYLATLRNAQ
ncbi:peptidase S10 [Sphaerisporangium sp. NPDC051011]|uniref:S10 family peptidase n=1 Tax=Sphaerisporangium sp. NPDC051011 TaxID=3155792 RepID=UPI0033D91FD7